jgi:tetratricopeptide (TPR) repeat protein
MKNKYILAAAAALASLVSCDKFLDTMPDNRTEIDSAQKVAALLGAAYPERVYSMLTELMSDNMDNNRAVVTEDADRLYQSIWKWEDNTEEGLDSDEDLWENFWMSIAAANHALVAIEELGGPSASPSLAESYGEALLARAYCHFILVNVFCLQYNEETSATDQGLPYMDKPEYGLKPKYDRGNVAEVYKRIDEDIQEGLKYVGDNYSVLKYHFNKQAAYAFAARFYLYYGQYEKAVQYANNCLGPNPQGYLRDYADLQANTSTISEARKAYNSSESQANFLMITGESNAGLLWGNYSGEFKHYAFTQYIARTEGFYAPTPWSNGARLSAASFVWRPREYTISSLEYPIFWKIDYEFEYTDPVAGIGFRHTVYPCFTADQTLLDRAEALILLKRYDEALVDLNLWANNMYVANINLTTDMIDSFYNKMEYYQWDKPTQKKKLEPRKPIVIQDTVQENMIHFLLNCRRTETMGLGMRWFDIKRYGITVYRREVNSNAEVVAITDTMGPDDLRRALQIPQKSRDAGFEANKREKKTSL